MGPWLPEGSFCCSGKVDHVVAAAVATSAEAAGLPAAELPVAGQTIDAEGGPGQQAKLPEQLLAYVPWQGSHKTFLAWPKSMCMYKSICLICGRPACCDVR